MNEKQVAKELIKLAKNITSYSYEYDQDKMKKRVRTINGDIRVLKGSIQGISYHLEKAEAVVGAWDAIEHLYNAQEYVEKVKDGVAEIDAHIRGALSYTDGAKE